MIEINRIILYLNTKGVLDNEFNPFSCTIPATEQTVRMYAERNMRRHKLTLIETTIISFLYNNPGRDTAADIVELRMLSKGNVSQAVELLIQKSLLKRIPDENDRRRIHLELLPDAIPITNEIDTIKETFRTELFHGFSKEEEEQLEFLNRKLMENAKNAFKMQQQNSDK